MDGFRSFLKARATSAQVTEWGLADLETFDYRQYLLERRAPVGDAFARYDGGELKRLFAEFQKESVERFFSHVRAEIDRRVGRHIVFASNNYRGSWEFPCNLFEIGMAELPERDATPLVLYERYRESRALQKHQIFTLVPQATDGSEIPLTRRVIASCYALGGHLIVPWDVYTGSQKPRYYGKPEDYADLYKFVRDYPQWFDGYEEAAFVLEDFRDERYKTEPPLLIDAPRVMGVVRAKPQEPASPVVVHLVNWQDNSGPFAIRINRRRFSQVLFSRAMFYSPGRTPQDLSFTDVGEGCIALEVPSLNPWGIVVLGATSDQDSK